MFYYGITKGKYPNPFLTITAKKITLVIEFHLKSASIGFFKYQYDIKKGFFHLNAFKFSITKFTH